MRLSVAHPQQLGRLAEGDRWIYADDDIADYARVAQEYGEAQRLLDPAAFQAEISRTAGEFLDWVDTALAGQPPYYWIAASYFKDVVCTPVLLHLACLRAASGENASGRNIVFVTRSLALAAQVMALGGRRRSQAASWWPDALRQCAAAWAHWLVRPWQIWLRSLLVAVQLGPGYRRKLGRAQILVDTFFFPEDLAPDGCYRDRFSPGLLDWYAAQGLHAVAMPYTGQVPLRVMLEAYRRMRRSTTLFALGECFLGIADCLRGAWRALRILLLPPDFRATPFSGLQVGPLVSRWWKVSALQTVTYQIWMQVPRNMSRYGLRPDTVLDWYENQPLDKAICLGFQHDCRHTHVIAGRQFMPAAGIVNFFSTEGEISAGAAPRLNWVCGKRVAELFARHDRVGRYDVVPALRYAHLFAGSESAAQKRSLVIFLTSSLKESMGILECVFAVDADARSGFDTIAIKMHQSVDADLREGVERRWPATRDPHIVWEQRAASILLDEAALVVTGGSSVALEAVCHGVPVIVSGQLAGISYNMLEVADQRLWRLAYGPQEFEKLLHEWLPKIPDQATRLEIGHQIRDQHFEATNPTTMQAFDPRQIDDPAHRAGKSQR
jgi:hypothetical protein